MSGEALTWATWPPNTSFRLCNVTWDASYRDVVRFDDTKAQDSYFDGLPAKVIRNATMAKFGVPVDLPIPFNQASKYNYIVVYNDYDFDDRRKWYYFIQTVEYVNANMSRFHVMLDVWQSFQFDVEFGRCFVERGHVGIANERQMDDHGVTYLDIPEGLDTGGAGVIREDITQPFISNASNTDPQGAGVVIVSTVELTVDPRTKEDPQLKTATGSNINNVANGVSIYYLDSVDDFVTFMWESSDYPWVTEGIIGIWMVPRFAVRRTNEPVKALGGKATHTRMYPIVSASYSGVQKRIDRFRDIISGMIPKRYRHLRKLGIYPYAYIEMTMQNGNSIIIQPQYVDDDALTLHADIWASAPSPRGAYYIDGYYDGEELNAAIGVMDWPRLVMVNNQGVAYLASNAHSLQYAYNSADWAQQKTQMGVNNAYAQANLGAGYSTQQTNLGNRNRNAQNAITQSSLQTGNDIAAQQQNTDYWINQTGAVVNGILGAGSQLAGGNLGGAAGTAVGTGAQIGANWVSNEQRTMTRNANLANTLGTNSAQTSQANSFASSSTALSNQQTLQFADMNRSLGLAVASGDYANTIAGINAKVQDAQLSQPSVSGGMGGDAFLYALDKWSVHLRFKTMNSAAMRNVGEFWLRYGYYVQRFMTPPRNLLCMTRFTYWKMHELYIRSSTCPEEFRLTIKGIFEKGVTVWKHPEDIGVIDYADNEPLDGISY